MATKGDASKTMLIDIPPDIMRKISTGKLIPVRKRRLFRGGVPPPPRPPAVTVENADLQELFQGVYDAGLITRLNGEILDANLRAVQFFQYTRPQFAALTLSDLIIGFTPDLIQTILDNLREEKFTLIMAQCLRRDGTHFPAEISSSRLRLSGQEYLCFFVRDITARREAENALLKAHQELEREMAERERINQELTREIEERRRAQQELSQAVETLRQHDRAKSQFVSNVSHELKTPLASIQYVAANLLRGVAGPLAPAVRNYVEMIREDGQRLGRTVEDILDMSRIEANTLNLALMTLPLADVVMRAVASMRVQAEAEDLTLSAAIQGEGRFVRADPQKIERVLFNLIRNAIKFNVPGGTIEVTLRDDPHHPGYVTLAVSDSGIGIEPQHIPHVTDRFFRVGEQVSGTGLGLWICKDLIERHGGTLDIQSPPPQRSRGTQVTARLPVVPPPTVAIIYRNRALRLELTRQLAAAGYTVVGVELGEDVVSRLRAERAELAVVDWTSAGLEAGVAIAKIRNEKDGQTLPIVGVVGTEAETSTTDILDGLGIPRVVWPWKGREILDRLYEAIVNRKRLEKRNT